MPLRPFLTQSSISSNSSTSSPRNSNPVMAVAPNHSTTSSTNPTNTRANSLSISINLDDLPSDVDPDHYLPNNDNSSNNHNNHYLNNPFADSDDDEENDEEDVEFDSPSRNRRRNGRTSSINTSRSFEIPLEQHQLSPRASVESFGDHTNLNGISSSSSTNMPNISSLISTSSGNGANGAIMRNELAGEGEEEEFSSEVGMQRGGIMDWSSSVTRTVTTTTTSSADVNTMANDSNSEDTAPGMLGGSIPSSRTIPTSSSSSSNSNSGLGFSFQGRTRSGTIRPPLDSPQDSFPAPPARTGLGFGMGIGMRLAKEREREEKGANDNENVNGDGNVGSESGAIEEEGSDSDVEEQEEEDEHDNWMDGIVATTTSVTTTTMTTTTGDNSDDDGEEDEGDVMRGLNRILNGGKGTNGNVTSNPNPNPNWEDASKSQWFPHHPGSKLIEEEDQEEDEEQEEKDGDYQPNNWMDGIVATTTSTTTMTVTEVEGDNTDNEEEEDGGVMRGLSRILNRNSSSNSQNGTVNQNLNQNSTSTRGGSPKPHQLLPHHPGSRLIEKDEDEEGSEGEDGDYQRNNWMDGIVATTTSTSTTMTVTEVEDDDDRDGEDGDVMRGLSRILNGKGTANGNGHAHNDIVNPNPNSNPNPTSNGVASSKPHQLPHHPGSRLIEEDQEWSENEEEGEDDDYQPNNWMDGIVATTTSTTTTMTTEDIVGGNDSDNEDEDGNVMRGLNRILHGKGNSNNNVNSDANRKSNQVDASKPNRLPHHPGSTLIQGEINSDEEEEGDDGDYQPNNWMDGLVATTTTTTTTTEEETVKGDNNSDGEAGDVMSGLNRILNGKGKGNGNDSAANLNRDGNHRNAKANSAATTNNNSSSNIRIDSSSQQQGSFVDPTTGIALPFQMPGHHHHHTSSVPPMWLPNNNNGNNISSPDSPMMMSMGPGMGMGMPYPQQQQMPTMGYPMGTMNPMMGGGYPNMNMGHSYPMMMMMMPMGGGGSMMGMPTPMQMSMPMSMPFQQPFTSPSHHHHSSSTTASGSQTFPGVSTPPFQQQHHHQQSSQSQSHYPSQSQSQPHPYQQQPQTWEQQFREQREQQQREMARQTWLVIVCPPDHLMELSATHPSIPGPPSRLRSGLLLPLQRTLNSQLASIARSFSLPSIAGISLYLDLGFSSGSGPGPGMMGIGINNPNFNSHNSGGSNGGSERTEQSGVRTNATGATAGTSGSGSGDPLLKPRLSEDVWNCIWAPLFPPRAGGGGAATNPSPTTPTAFASQQLPHSRSESSANDGNAATGNGMGMMGGFGLGMGMGTGSGFRTPIIARLEFDIDTRKARWYEQWILAANRISASQSAPTRPSNLPNNNNNNPLNRRTSTDTTSSSVYSQISSQYPPPSLRRGSSMSYSTTNAGNQSGSWVNSREIRPESSMSMYRDADTLEETEEEREYVADDTEVRPQSRGSNLGGGGIVPSNLGNPRKQRNSVNGFTAAGLIPFGSGASPNGVRRMYLSRSESMVTPSAHASAGSSDYFGNGSIGGSSSRPSSPETVRRGGVTPQKPISLLEGRATTTASGTRSLNLAGVGRRPSYVGRGRSATGGSSISSDRGTVVSSGRPGSRPTVKRETSLDSGFVSASAMVMVETSTEVTANETVSGETSASLVDPHNAHGEDGVFQPIAKVWTGPIAGTVEDDDEYDSWPPTPDSPDRLPSPDIAERNMSFTPANPDQKFPIVRKASKIFRDGSGVSPWEGFTRDERRPKLIEVDQLMEVTMKPLREISGTPTPFMMAEDTGEFEKRQIQELVNSTVRLGSNYPFIELYPATYPNFDLYPTLKPIIEIPSLEYRKVTGGGDRPYPHSVNRIYPAVYPRFDLYKPLGPLISLPPTEYKTSPAKEGPYPYNLMSIYPSTYPRFNLYPSMGPKIIGGRPPEIPPRVFHYPYSVLSLYPSVYPHSVYQNLYPILGPKIHHSTSRPAALTLVTGTLPLTFALDSATSSNWPDSPTSPERLPSADLDGRLAGSVPPTALLGSSEHNFNRSIPSLQFPHDVSAATSMDHTDSNRMYNKYDRPTLLVGSDPDVRQVPLAVASLTSPEREMLDRDDNSLDADEIEEVDYENDVPREVGGESDVEFPEDHEFHFDHEEDFDRQHEELFQALDFKAAEMGLPPPNLTGRFEEDDDHDFASPLDYTGRAFTTSPNDAGFPQGVRGDGLSPRQSRLPAEYDEHEVQYAMAPPLVQHTHNHPLSAVSTAANELDEDSDSALPFGEFPQSVLFTFKSNIDLSEALAEFIIEAQDQSIERRGRFVIALSGGSLPKILSPALVSSDRVRWNLWEVFFVDERLVPLDHEDSNYRSCQEEIFSRVPIPQWQIHSIKSVPELSTDPKSVAEEICEDYEDQLAGCFGSGIQNGHPPAFDLILLGMGDDGHTASLFPGHPLTKEMDWFVAWLGDSPKKPSYRITMTLPVINNSRRVAFVITGEEKQPALAEVLESNSDGAEEPQSELPAALVRLGQHPVVFFTDADAAAKTSYPRSAFWDESDIEDEEIVEGMEEHEFYLQR